MRLVSRLNDIACPYLSAGSVTLGEFQAHIAVVSHLVLLWQQNAEAALEGVAEITGIDGLRKRLVSFGYSKTMQALALLPRTWRAWPFRPPSCEALESMEGNGLVNPAKPLILEALLASWQALSRAERYREIRAAIPVGRSLRLLCAVALALFVRLLSLDKKTLGRIHVVEPDEHRAIFAADLQAGCGGFLGKCHFCSLCEAAAKT